LVWAPAPNPIPHLRDLLNPHDEVFQREDFDNVDDNVEVVDISANETNVEGVDCTPNINHVHPTDCNPLDESTSSTVPPPSLSRQGPNPLDGIGVFNDTSLYGVIPPLRGSTVLLSDFSHSIAKRKIANTAIKRKSSGGVTALVEVAKASREAIATQIKGMATMTKEAETNKLEVQLKLFSEQMTYQRERDMRIYEQSSLATENARLVILKQGDIVLALTNISNVLSLGLRGHVDPPRKESTPEPTNEEC
jgi:hypothetical protein